MIQIDHSDEDCRPMRRAQMLPQTRDRVTENEFRFDESPLVEDIADGIQVVVHFSILVLDELRIWISGKRIQYYRQVLGLSLASKITSFHFLPFHPTIIGFRPSSRTIMICNT